MSFFNQQDHMAECRAASWPKLGLLVLLLWNVPSCFGTCALDHYEVEAHVNTTVTLKFCLSEHDSPITNVRCDSPFSYCEKRFCQNNIVGWSVGQKSYREVLQVEFRVAGKEDFCEFTLDIIQSYRFREVSATIHNVANDRGRQCPEKDSWRRSKHLDLCFKIYDSIDQSSNYSNAEKVCSEQGGELLSADEAAPDVLSQFTGRPAFWVKKGNNSSCQLYHSTKRTQLTNFCAYRKGFICKKVAPSLPCPTNLTVIGQTSHSVSLAWFRGDIGEAVQTFKIVSLTSRGMTNSYFVTVASDSRGYVSSTVDGLYSEIDFKFTVTPVNTVDHSSENEEQQSCPAAEVNAKTDPFPCIRNLTVTGKTSHSVTLSWFCGHMEQDVYKFRVVEQEQKSTSDMFACASGGYTSITMDGLSADTDFAFKVLTVNRFTNETEYGDKHCDTLIYARTDSLPCPRNLTVTGRTSHSVSLSWFSGQMDQAEQKFHVFYNVSVDGETTRSNNVIFVNDSEPYAWSTVNGLPSNTTFQFWIMAVNTSENEHLPCDIVKVSAKTDPLSCPLNLTVTGKTSHSVSLSWLPGHTGQAMQEFHVYYNVSVDGEFSRSDNVTFVNDSELYAWSTVKNLPADTSFQFLIMAVNTFSNTSENEHLSCGIAMVSAQTDKLPSVGSSQITETTATSFSTILVVCIVVFTILIITIIVGGALIYAKRKRFLKLKKKSKAPEESGLYFKFLNHTEDIVESNGQVCEKNGVEN